MSARDLYDGIGVGYTATRQPDPRLAAALHQALGDARTVLNVGAGAGAYEPRDREVRAVEPSAVMIAQRPPRAARVLQASAEALPLADDSVDAAMAVLTDHHWRDRLAGLRELRRVARRRVVLFNLDPSLADRFWLTGEYLPGHRRLIAARYRTPGIWTAELARELGAIHLEPFPIPHDCRDGFYAAFWRRPAAYLDQRVRDGISIFRLLPDDEVGAGMSRLGADLDTGRWKARHADLLQRDALDLGYRIVIAELG